MNQRKGYQPHTIRNKIKRILNDKALALLAVVFYVYATNELTGIGFQFIS